MICSQCKKYKKETTLLSLDCSQPHPGLPCSLPSINTLRLPNFLILKIYSSLASVLYTEHNLKLQAQDGGWGGLPYERAGMLVVSPRGVNCSFWSRLGCSVHIIPSYLAAKVSFRVALEEILQLYIFYLLESCDQSLKWLLLGVGPHPDWSSLEV